MATAIGEHQRLQRALALGVLLAFPLAAGACNKDSGGDTGGASGGGESGDARCSADSIKECDACTLLTREGIKEAAGVSVDEVKHGLGPSGEDSTACLFANNECRGGVLLQLRVLVNWERASQTPDRYRPIEGVGDEAYYQIQGPRELHVRVGGGGFTIEVSCVEREASAEGEDPRVEAAVALAKLVVEELR